MRTHRHRLETLVARLTALLVVLVLAAPADAARKPTVIVAIASTAVLSPSGQSATLEITARCARRWNVLEALVTISQPQTFGMGFFPLTCTGRRQTFAVAVPAQGEVFQPGEAQGSAFVLIERSGRTQQAQDSRVVQIVPAG